MNLSHEAHKERIFWLLIRIRTLQNVLEEALPELEKREREELERESENGNLDPLEYELECQSLDDTFDYWLPRFAAYSVISLLYAVLESQLNACTDRVRERSRSPFELSDIQGSGIEAAAVYLKKLKAYDVKQDKEWNTLCDLNKLRNIVAHRMGSKGHPEKHRRKIKHLSEKYPGDLKFSGSWWNNEEHISISMSLCRRFTDAVERVLNRVIKAVNTYPVEPATPSSEK